MSKNGHLNRLETARLLGVGRDTIHRWACSGYLRGEQEEHGCRAWKFRREDVLELRRVRDSLLSTEEVGRRLGVSETLVCQHAREGKIPHQDTPAWGWRFSEGDFVTYWRAEFGGVCLRCGILGEADPERGFLCVPCEYEKRTGRIYRWPVVPRRRLDPWPVGRLTLELGGDGGTLDP